MLVALVRSPDGGTKTAGAENRSGPKRSSPFRLGETLQAMYCDDFTVIREHADCSRRDAVLRIQRNRAAIAWADRIGTTLRGRAATKPERVKKKRRHRCVSYYLLSSSFAAAAINSLASLCIWAPSLSLPTTTARWLTSCPTARSR
jgi:hypothetical protein